MLVEIVLQSIIKFVDQINDETKKIGIQRVLMKPQSEEKYNGEK